MNRRSFRQVVSAFLVIFVCLPVLACALSDAPSFQELIRNSFEKGAGGPGFFMKRQTETYVEVCGDTCAYFEWRGDGNDENVWRFIVLYELDDEPGTDVPAFRDSVKALRADKLIEPRFCSIKGKDISTIICDWQTYSKSLGISVGHSRYDEGQRCYAKGVDRGVDKLRLLKWTCMPINSEESPFNTINKRP